MQEFTQAQLTEKYVSWLNDPEVVRYSEQRHRVHTLDSCLAYFLAQQGSGNLFLAVIAHEAALGHIGNIGVAWDSFNQVADVSILIGDKRAWKKGYAAEAWNAVIQYLSNQEQVRKITAGTASVNQSMLKLMQKSSMPIESTRPAQLMIDGLAVDVVYAGMIVRGKNDKKSKSSC